MKGLTIWQPWATLVATQHKRIETRGWSTRYQGPIAIHAAKKNTKDLRELEITWPFGDCLADALASGPLPRGKIVAVGRLVGCAPAASLIRMIAPGTLDRNPAFPEHELAFGNYSRSKDRFGWLIDRVFALPEPIEAPGAQGLWNVPDEIVEEIERQQRAAMAVAS